MTRSTRWGGHWESFPVSAPIRVEGGLTAKSQRGAIASTWWSKTFTTVLESYGLGSRLQRGRGYARAGQVLSLEVSAGLITAQVQGSRKVPYVVSLDTVVPNEHQWRIIDAALANRVGLAAHLMAGDVPADLEEVFAQAKAPLFPSKWVDLRARCTCPDSANPCKHIAAALYLFAEQLEVDPWLLLKWRGRTREEVLAALGLAERGNGDDLAMAPWWPLRPGEPLAAQRVRQVDNVTGAADPPHAVLARLGELTVEAWKAPAFVTLQSCYAAVAADLAARKDVPIQTSNTSSIVQP